MQVTSDRTRKGELRMLALVEDINRYAQKCSTYAGAVVPGPAVEFEDFDSIINELDRALVEIRTLDLEVFQASDESAYLALRDGSDQGRVVHALGSLRNVATHGADVVDPDISRAVGPVEGRGFVIFAKWKRRADLPSGTFTFRGRVDNARIASYDRHVAGRLVLDTLFDVFAFFDACDGRLAPRDSVGRVVGFPIAPLPVVFGYYRLGPDWPTHEEYQRNATKRAIDKAPSGTGRAVVGTIEGGAIVCGWTDEGHGRRGSFTEPVRQVVVDIGHGYPYVLSANDSAVSANGGQLVCTDGRLLAQVVPDVSSSADAHWVTWWARVRDHADLYVDQRRGL